MSITSSVYFSHISDLSTHSIVCSFFFSAFCALFFRFCSLVSNTLRITILSHSDSQILCSCLMLFLLFFCARSYNAVKQQQFMYITVFIHVLTSSSLVFKHIGKILSSFTIQTLERALGQILHQSLHQCPTVLAQLRLLEVFEGISGREMVHVSCVEFSEPSLLLFCF